MNRIVEGKGKFPWDVLLAQIIVFLSILIADSRFTVLVVKDLLCFNQKNFPFFLYSLFVCSVLEIFIEYLILCEI